MAALPPLACSPANMRRRVSYLCENATPRSPYSLDRRDNPCQHCHERGPGNRPPQKLGFDAHRRPKWKELLPNFGDGPRVQAAAVWDFEDVGFAATSIPSVNLTP